MRSVFGIICAFSLLLQSASFSLRAVPRFLSLTSSRSGASHGDASHYLHASAQDDDVRVEQVREFMAAYNLSLTHPILLHFFVSASLN